MELSTTMLRAFPSLPRRPLVSDSSFALAFRPTLPTSFAKPLTSRSKQGFGFAGGHWLRASASDETSTAVSEKYGAAKNDEAPTKIEVVSYGGFAEQESSAGGEESEVGNPLNQLDLKMWNTHLCYCSQGGGIWKLSDFVPLNCPSFVGSLLQNFISKTLLCTAGPFTA
ncbi:uncharacterized protein [Typha latifolia]|uniref:uncharacterized protein isoform X2 n=1 Tax=Typha latifolia TaxID=4733 RepID=UPI003C300AEA